MALDDAALKTSIQNLLDGTVPMTTVTDAGNAWGDALHNYSVDGVVENPALTFISSTGLDLALPALKSALIAAFSTLPGNPASVASSITAAFSTYWTAAVFAGATPPSVPTGGPALTASLTSIFSFVGGSHDTKSTEIRDAIAAFTKAVQVVFPGPVPPAGTFNVE